MILAARTDTWDVELYLLGDDGEIIEKKSWNAGRNLSRDLLVEIENLVEKDDGDIRAPGYLSGVIVFKGPGSFTGLRIGVSVLNAVAFSLKVPIIGEKSENWLENGVQRLGNSGNDEIVVPDYGREPNITKPKK